MASASLHGDRSYVVSRGKKTPSPVVQGSKTPIPRTSEAKKRLNSSDGRSKQLVSAAKVSTSTAKQRPSDILNPKTVDPVSIFCLSCCTFRQSFSDIWSFFLAEISYYLGVYKISAKLVNDSSYRVNLFDKSKQSLIIYGLDFSSTTRHQSLHLLQVTQMVEYLAGRSTHSQNLSATVN